MERPRIIIHILSALDGKITGPFMERPSARAAGGQYGRIRLEYNGDAWLYGTVTTKEFTGCRPPILDEAEDNAFEKDFVAKRDAEIYYVSVDPLGEIGWESGEFKRAGNPDAHVIEILTEKTPAAYRAYLQKRGVSYITAGAERLGCQTACEKLYRLFAVKTMLICGGGAVNWTFLQEGVVDEISLLLAPAADGSPDSPAVFQQSPLLKESRPIEFHLKDMRRLQKDAVHLIYTVERQDRKTEGS